jgi:hypothetical protein
MTVWSALALDIFDFDDVEPGRTAVSAVRPRLVGSST